MNIHSFFKYLFAAAVLAISAMSAEADTVYEVKKGDTIFGIANKYLITPEQLVEWNPQANKGVKKGMKLIIKDGAGNSEVKIKPTASTVQPQPATATTPKTDIADQKTSEQPHVYVAQEEESMKDISKKTKVKKDRLIELNPFLDPAKVAAGTRVRLDDQAPMFDDSVASVEDVIIEDTDNIEEVAEGTNIMVLLPFMANAEERSKQAKYYGDFYRGMLLAAEELNSANDSPIEIFAYDTNGSLSELKELLKANAGNSPAVIITPEDEASMQPIFDFATENGVFALNMFNFKEQAFRTNPWVMQGNIDQSTMYAKAIEGIKHEFPGYVPVILESKGAKAEKEGFTSLLESTFAAEGNPTLRISFEEALTPEDFDALAPDQKYVFIPQSGSLPVFNKVAGAILHKRQANPEEPDKYVLFGYPDWTAFRGESLDLLHDINAVIYSRFYSNESDPAYANFQRKYHDWYGRNTIEVVPDQGILGYDAATFLLSALRQGPLSQSYATQHRGIQSAFSFERVGEGGLLNTSLFLIRYQPDSTCSSVIL